MSVRSPTSSTESDADRRKRRSAERLGAVLFIVTGVAGVIATICAVISDGFWADVKLDAADYGLPWWITLAIGIFGVVAGSWALLSRR